LRGGGGLHDTPGGQLGISGMMKQSALPWWRSMRSGRSTEIPSGHSYFTGGGGL
jgi:hypothetical protein